MSALHVQTGEVGHFSAAALQPPHPAPITVNRLMSLRAAPIALLVFASLLGGFNLASHFAFVTSTLPAPINLSANFAFYAELGDPIQFCETGSVTGHSGATAPQCETLIDPQSLSRRSEMLGEGDYVGCNWMPRLWQSVNSWTSGGCPACSVKRRVASGWCGSCVRFR